MTNKEMTNKEAINLISRNKSVFKYDTKMTKALDLAIKVLEKEVTKEARELLSKEKRRGKWKYHKAEDIFLPYMECDNCGLEELIDEENITPKRFRDYYKYCPNCGARMNGGRQ